MNLTSTSRVFIAVLCIVITGCSNNSEPTNITNCSNKQIVKSFKKSFDIPNQDIIPSETYVFTDQGTEYIVFSDASERFLRVFDFSTGKLKHKIDVQSAIGKSEDYYNSSMLNGFYFSSFDSIFLLYNPTNDIFLIDAQENLINSWNVSSARSNGIDMFLYTYFSSAPLLFKKDRLYAFQQTELRDYGSSIEERKIIFETGFEACIQLETDTAYVVNEMGFYPHSFLDKYFYEDTPSRIRNSKNERVISFGFTDSIYVLSEMDTLQVEVRSNSSKEFRSFDPKQETNMNYIEEYFVEETRYYRIILDPYRNLYYRVVLHGIPYRNDDGTKKFILG